MASKRSTIGRKIQSSGINSSTIPYDERMFRSLIYEKFYTELERGNLVQEKILELGDLREYFDVLEEITAQS